jgi:hypothetical protein
MFDQQRIKSTDSRPSMEQSTIVKEQRGARTVDFILRAPRFNPPHHRDAPANGDLRVDRGMPQRCGQRPVGVGLRLSTGNRCNDRCYVRPAQGDIRKTHGTHLDRLDE